MRKMNTSDQLLSLRAPFYIAFLMARESQAHVPIIREVLPGAIYAPNSEMMNIKEPSLDEIWDQDVAANWY